MFDILWIYFPDRVLAMCESTWQLGFYECDYAPRLVVQFLYSTISSICNLLQALSPSFIWYGFFSLPFTAEIKVLMILMRRKFHQHYDAVGWPCYISTVAYRNKAEGAAESVVTDTHKNSHILTNWHPSQKLYQSTPALKLFYRAFPQYKQCITTPSTLNVCHVCVTNYYRKANKKQKKVVNT